MRYKTGDIVRAAVDIPDHPGRIDKGDVCIVEHSMELLDDAVDWGMSRRGKRQRLVMCWVVHLRGGKRVLVSEVQLEPVGKNDDATTTD